MDIQHKKKRKSKYHGVSFKSCYIMLKCHAVKINVIICDVNFCFSLQINVLWLSMLSFIVCELRVNIQLRVTVPVVYHYHLFLCVPLKMWIDLLSLG